MIADQVNAKDEWTLDELAEAAGACARGDVTRTIRRIASLQDATSDAVAVFCDERYRSDLDRTNAGAVILKETDAADFDGDCLISRNPRAAFGRIVAHLHGEERYARGIHLSATVSDQAVIAPGATVCAGAVIERDAKIGEHAIIGSGAYVGTGVSIGESTRIDSNVVIYRDCAIGRNCNVSANAVIGSPGFSYAREGKRWLKIPNVGNVLIGDEVDIGAATTIDRATMDSTAIGDGVKIDNNVQIAHNVSIGEDTIIAGNVGIAGSARIGRRCMFGGQSSVLDHLQICDDVIVNAGAMVTKSITVAGEYSATLPAQPATKWRKTLARLRLLSE